MPQLFLRALQQQMKRLARKIERMAQTLQKVEASYRGIVEDQTDLICRYHGDGRLTFVNAAYANFFARKGQELVGLPFPLFDRGLDAAGYQTLLLTGALGDGEGSFEGLADHHGVDRRTVDGLGPALRPRDDLRALVHLIRLMRSWRKSPSKVTASAPAEWAARWTPRAKPAAPAPPS